MHKADYTTHSRDHHTDEHAAATNVVQAFGGCLNAYLADACALGMADGNQHDDAPGTRIAIGPMDV
jgi:hypothetical protein